MYGAWVDFIGGINTFDGYVQMLVRSMLMQPFMHILLPSMNIMQLSLCISRSGAGVIDSTIQ